MMIKPVLRKITIYPVKSLDGMDLQKAMITEGGCLLHDREFAISDSAGNFIIGKSNPLVHSLRSEVDFDTEIISFRHTNEITWTHFHLHKEKSAIQAYLSDYFGMETIMHQNKTGRFLDMPDVSGVTVISNSSLQEVSGWFGQMNIGETRNRFRATLEIEGVPAFWEDRLFSKEGRGIEFKIGEVTMIGMGPRARCVVPTRNPETGEVFHAFAKSFSKYRASSIPEWSTLQEYGHHYYLTVNCCIPATETGKTIETGNEITIIGEKVF